MFGRISERFVVRNDFSEYFPMAEFAGYDAFIGISGKVLKTEKRTRVVLLHRQDRRFVFKEYLYPWLPRTRTWLRISKAEHEFNSLRHVAELGLACAEPVAYGASKTRFGFVRSCFIITSFVEDSVTLWDRAAKQDNPDAINERARICRTLGKNLRRLHQAGLFLFTAKPKNILLRGDRDTIQVVFIDLPYARFLRWRPLARWGQARDLAVVLGNYMPRMSEQDTAPFYEAYFPDPLGAHERAVRKRVARAVRVRRNQTLISRLVHQLRRGAKSVKAWLTLRTSKGDEIGA